MTIQSTLQFCQVAPAVVPTPSAGYYSFFVSDGTSSTIAGGYYKKDSGGTVTALIPAAYTDEQAEDAVGNILTDSATIDFTYDDTGNTITAVVKAASVTNAMLADVATGTIKGRVTAGTGSIENLTGTQATTLLDVATTTLKGLLSPADKVSLNAIKAGIFNPYDYGTVDATGAVSSNAAFAAAVAAMIAAPRGGVLVIPVGVFLVNTGTIDFSTSSNPMAVLGFDRSLSVLVPNGIGTMIKLSSTADGASIKDMAFFSSGATQTAGQAIDTNGCDDVLIENVLFNNQFIDVNVQGTSIKVSITKTVHTRGVNNGTGSIGIQVTNGAAGDTYIGPDVVMTDNTVATGVRRKACVEIVQSGHYEVTQANLTGSNIGILVDPGAGQIVAFGFHNQVLCDSNVAWGMQITSGTATSTVKNIKSTNSWYCGTSVAGGFGIGLYGVAGGILNGITFTSDRILNNQQHGIDYNFGTDVRFVGCDVKGNSAQTSNTYDGLRVAAAVSNWSVLGGKFGGNDTTATGGQQKYGINVLAGAGDNIKILPDDCLGNLTAPVFIGATGVNVYVGEYIGGLVPQSKTANTAIVSSTAVQSLGTFTLSAEVMRSLQVGDILMLEASGYASQTGVTAVTFTFTMRCGAVGSVTAASVIAQGAGLGPASATVNRPFTITGYARVTAVGASGAMIGTVMWDQGYALAATATPAILTPVTVDTTQARDIALCMAQSVATSVVTGQITVAVLRKMK